MHVLAFSSYGGLLVVESEGEFNIDIWEEIYEMAKNICRGSGDHHDDNEDIDMDNEQQTPLESILRDTIRRKTIKEQEWKGNLP